jgi:hypothetical protein
MSLVGRGGIIHIYLKLHKYVDYIINTILNTNYITKTTVSKLHLHTKSGGQMSPQSPVVWWYREVAGMCVEAVPVLGAESVDFLFN